MSLSLIAGFPGLISFLVCIRYDAKKAFLWVYLPTLLLLPDDYRWPIIGRLTFHEAAIVPIAIAFLFRSWRSWKFSLADVLLTGFCTCTVVSQYYNRNFSDARNTLLRDVTYILIPYMLAKGLFYRDKFGLDVAKRICILLAIVSVASVYEFKMSVDLFEVVLNPFFTVTREGETFRYGLTRVAGPFGHALIAGIVLLVGYRLVRWLEWRGCWEGISILGLNTVTICKLLIVVGAAMTVARGAWTGAMAGSLIVLIGRARNRVWTMAITIAVIIIIGFPLYWGIRAYVSHGSGLDVPDAQRNAAYRVNLIVDYLPIIEQRPALGYGQGKGWGTAPFPVIDGMWSIDDDYLLTALTYGLYALALWAGLLVWMLTRLVWYGLQRPGDDPSGSLAWTLTGACILYSVALATVYLGGQAGPILYMLLGWAEGLLLPSSAPERTVENAAAQTTIPCVRVMAGVIVPG